MQKVNNRWYNCTHNRNKSDWHINEWAITQPHNTDMTTVRALTSNYPLHSDFTRHHTLLLLNSMYIARTRGVPHSDRFFLFQRQIYWQTVQNWKITSEMLLQRKKKRSKKNNTWMEWERGKNHTKTRSQPREPILIITVVPILFRSSYSFYL